MLKWLRTWLTLKTRRRSRLTHCSFDGQCIAVEGPRGDRTTVKIEDVREIGVETTEDGPFDEDVFWLVNRDAEGLRIPQGSPVFKKLMDAFGSFEGFDWPSFTEAMSCTDCHYFLCWKRPSESSGAANGLN